MMLKAGHLVADRLIDIFYNAETDKCLNLESPKIQTPNTHGTGCTLSSAIASYLAKGYGLNHAVESAKEYLYKAIVSGSKYSIGNGHGPVNHFHNLWVD